MRAIILRPLTIHTLCVFALAGCGGGGTSSGDVTYEALTSYFDAVTVSPSKLSVGIASQNIGTTGYGYGTVELASSQISFFSQTSLSKVVLPGSLNRQVSKTITTSNAPN